MSAFTPAELAMAMAALAALPDRLCHASQETPRHRPGAREKRRDARVDEGQPVLASRDDLAALRADVDRLTALELTSSRELAAERRKVAGLETRLQTLEGELHRQGIPIPPPG